MINPSEFELPGFVMHGARTVIVLARRPEFFERQVDQLEQAVINQPALAIDLAKALVETTCKTVLNDRKLPLDNAWDLPQLFRATINCLKFAPDHIRNEAAVEASLRRTSGSLQGVVQGLCEIRNQEGFASHGRDGYAATLDIIHAEFVARSADAVISFLYKTHFQDRIQHRRLLYDDNSEVNEWIDDQNSPISISYRDAAGENINLEYTSSEVLFNIDQDAYKVALNEHQNIFAENTEAVLESDG